MAIDRPNIVASTDSLGRCPRETLFVRMHAGCIGCLRRVCTSFGPGRYGANACFANAGLFSMFSIHAVVQMLRRVDPPSGAWPKDGVACAVRAAAQAALTSTGPAMVSTPRLYKTVRQVQWVWDGCVVHRVSCYSSLEMLSVKVELFQGFAFSRISTWNCLVDPEYHWGFMKKPEDEGGGRPVTRLLGVV